MHLYPGIGQIYQGWTGQPPLARSTAASYARWANCSATHGHLSDSVPVPLAPDLNCSASHRRRRRFAALARDRDRLYLAIVHLGCIDRNVEAVD